MSRIIPSDEFYLDSNDNDVKLLPNDLSKILLDLYNFINKTDENMNEVWLKFPYNIELKHNELKPNDEHRGSNHTRIILDFPRLLSINKKELMLLEFAEYLYRIKSNKFDHHYEMFYKIETITNLGNKSRWNLKFDYGS